MIDPEPYSELRVPHSGGAIPATIGCSLLGLFTLVAAGNLWYAHHVSLTALIASLLWLLLVAFLFVSSVLDEGGIRQFIVNFLGVFSQYHFVCTTPGSDRAITICIGYMLFGRPHYRLSIDLTALSSIDWRTGQGTAISGRDMDDWHVTLWYHHPEGPRQKSVPGMRSEELFIIGPSGPRETTEAFGQQLVEFLRNAGVQLSEGKDSREFNSPSRSADAG